MLPEMALDDEQTANQPLAGVVLCCTSIPADVRAQLASAASQMGATLRLDLTSDVTHLLVGKLDTPKYRYVAKERPDIRVLGAGWVEAVRRAWMAGDDDDDEGNEGNGSGRGIDVAALERAHTLPALFGLKLCVTKFESAERQAHFADGAARHGAAFSGDLTRDVTHLVAARPHGDKYAHAKAWGIHVVSARWFDDSLRRGMALDESLYAPELPEEEQGRGAFRVERKAGRTSLGKRERSGEEDLEALSGGAAGKRKMRRVASMRLEGHSQDLWHGLSGRELHAAGRRTRDAWTDEPTRDDDSFTQQIDEADRSGSRAQQAKPVAADESEGLFANQYILIHGFEPKRADRLRGFLEPNGAHVVRTVQELVSTAADGSSYILTPHGTPIKKLALPEIPPGVRRTTEWWVERCIHYKRLLDPASDMLSRPLGDTVVSGLGAVLISTTGFTGVDLRQTAEAIKLMNAEYQEVLLPSTQVLVCASETIKKEKAFYAAKHNIPVVRAEWLWECLRTEAKAPIDKYRMRQPAGKSADLSQPLSARSPRPSNPPHHQPTDGTHRANEKPKRLSSTRRRPVTPSLMLKPAKPDAPKAGPFIHEDEDDMAPAADEATPTIDDGPAFTTSQPLREISPNASPRKAEAAWPDAEREQPEKAISEMGSRNVFGGASLHSSPKQGDSVHDRTGERLTEQIASLMERRRASRTEAADTMSPQKRKSRPLGRNLSGIGHRPMSLSARSDSASRTFPADMHESNSPADGFNFAPRQEEEAPSTQLGYETLETEAHRKQMSKKMGTDLHAQSTGKRLESLGTVKDSETVTRRAMRERAKGRQRQHK